MALSGLRENGPFFHNTKAQLRANHVCFTALPEGAGLAAELAAGDGTPRGYEVAEWTRLTPEALQAWRGRLATILDEGGEITD